MKLANRYEQENEQSLNGNINPFIEITLKTGRRIYSNTQRKPIELIALLILLNIRVIDSQIFILGGGSFMVSLYFESGQVTSATKFHNIYCAALLCEMFFVTPPLRTTSYKPLYNFNGTWGIVSVLLTKIYSQTLELYFFRYTFI